MVELRLKIMQTGCTALGSTSKNREPHRTDRSLQYNQVWYFSFL